MNDRLWLDPKALRRFIDSRADSRPLVLANGCFDIFHVGHVRYLEAAASLGSTLVVAINDDESTRKLKGRGRPVMPVMDRAAIVLALRCVDHVLVFGSDTVDGIIMELAPEFHAKGTDYTPETVPERETAEKIGCRTIIVGDPKTRSSGDIVRIIRETE